jgi:hypothetical protein
MYTVTLIGIVIMNPLLYNEFIIIKNCKEILKKSWQSGSSGRAHAEQVRSPEFNPRTYE